MRLKDLTELIEQAAERTAERGRLAKIAGGYRPNEEYERLIKIREDNPDQYDKIVTSTLRMSVGYCACPSGIAHVRRVLRGIQDGTCRRRQARKDRKMTGRQHAAEEFIQSE